MWVFPVPGLHVTVNYVYLPKNTSDDCKGVTHFCSKKSWWFVYLLHITLPPAQFGYGMSNIHNDRMLYTIIWWKFPFTNNTHELAALVCWEEFIKHNTPRISHSVSVIVAKKMLYQSRASVWYASATHVTLGLRSLCQRNFPSDYYRLAFHECNHTFRYDDIQMGCNHAKWVSICCFQYTCSCLRHFAATLSRKPHEN